MLQKTIYIPTLGRELPIPEHYYLSIWSSDDLVIVLTIRVFNIEYYIEDYQNILGNMGGWVGPNPSGKVGKPSL